MVEDKTWHSRGFKMILILCSISSVKCDIECENSICLTCTDNKPFICDECNHRFASIMINNVCLSDCPYGFYTNPCTPTTDAVVDVTFEENRFQGSYGPLITGQSSSTYNPFFYPEKEDPIPSYKQGLYFDGSGQYLSIPEHFYFYYSIALCLWVKIVKPIFDNDILCIEYWGWSKLLCVKSNGQLQVSVENRYRSYSYYWTGHLPLASNIWYFISYRVSYDLDTYHTTLSNYLNVNSYSYLSTWANVMFRWSGSGQLSLVIGKNYNGWIYSFKFWNADINSFRAEYNAICGSGTNSCFINCDYGKHWDGNDCHDCSKVCTTGCIAANKCNCYDLLCAVCAGWGPGLCIQCAENASGGGETPCTCKPGFCNMGWLICKSCLTGCATWTGNNYYQCSSCLPNYYLLSSMCLKFCPSGYIKDPINHICILSTKNPLSLVFQNQIHLDSLSGVAVGSSRLNSYPNFEAYDPIPTIHRGYYFQKHSYMISSSLIISPYFTVTTWIYASGSGNVITKYHDSIYFCLSIDSTGHPSLMLKLMIHL